jgi:TM2 domain-containing membrane protein YozV
MRFRHKALAALLASAAGALGAHRLYLGQRYWWLPLAITAACAPLLIGVKNWYQTPAFFVLMVPVIAGFIHALVLALMPDDVFDARYNAGAARRNDSGWAAVLVAAGTLFVGAIVTVTAIVLLFQTYFEHTLRVAD